MKYYAYQNTNRIQMISSSGGAFTKIVTNIVDRYAEKNVVIYGAYWNDLTVEYGRFIGKTGLSKFAKSKYVKAKITNEIFELVENDLNDNKIVVFSGIPCQVDAIKRVTTLKTDYPNNLILIDVICHGAPNDVLFKSYIKHLERLNKSNVCFIDFRSKKDGWKGYKTEVGFTDGNYLFDTYESNLYMRLFFSYFGLSKGCFKCPYSNMNRVSDITLGDWWGIENEFPEFDVKNGVSLIITNTKIGEEILTDINSGINNNSEEKIMEFDKPVFLKYQHNLNEPTKKPINYDQFWFDYNKYGFEYVIKKYNLLTLPNKLKFTIRKIMRKLNLSNYE